MKKIFFTIIGIILISIIWAQWNNDPLLNLPINTEAGDQTISKIAVANNFNTFIGFFSNENGNYNVRLQLLDSIGNFLWEDEGILVSNHTQMSWLTDWDMKADNNGNAVLVFQDIRNAGNNNVVAYCISQDGNFLWGNDGIMLSNNEAFSVSPKIAVTGAGNSVVAWQEDDKIVIQKISPSGELLFGNQGIILQETDITFSWPQIITFDDDSFVLKYFKDSGPAWSPIREVYAQKYDASGDAVWNNECAISIAGGISAWTQIFPITKDYNNGFYIAWHEDRDMDNLSEIYIQHISSDGNVTFAQNGIEICTNTTQNHFYPELLFFGDYTIAVWAEMDGDQNQRGLYAQKISTSGELLWGSNGLSIIPLSSINTIPINIRKVDNDFVTYYYQNPSGTNDYIYAQRLDENGETVWENPITTISNSNSEKLHIVTSPFVNGQSIVAWGDNRSGNGDIYAQNLFDDGSIGPPSVIPPVIVISFDLAIENNNIVVMWSTASETNLIFWKIYRNENDDFGSSNLVTSVDAVNSIEQHDYSYTDSDNFEDGQTYYYWLEAVENDGTTTVLGNTSILYHPTDAQEDNLSATVKMINNYPNPFNPTTTISFYLSKKADANISIYNMKGQEVRKLNANGEKIGINQVVWNGKNDEGKPVTSGVYLYKLMIDGKTVAAKKCVLLK